MPVHGNYRSCVVSGCFSSLLALSSCTDSTPDWLENWDGGVAASGASASPAGSEDSGAAGSGGFGGSGGSGGAGAGGSGGSSVAGTGGSPSAAGSGGSGGSDGIAGGAGSASQAGSGGATAEGGAGAGAEGTAGSGGDAIPPDSEQNLFADPGFETSLGRWSRFGPASLTRSTAFAHTGSASLLVSNRTEAWQGPAYNVTNLLASGAEYEVRVWLQASADTVPSPGNTVRLMLRRDCAQEELGVGASTPLVSATLDADWVELGAVLQVPTCELDSLVLHLDGLPPGVDLYLDDVSLVRRP
ncbi:MAG TPA: carbohydrate binding domain-containing protein [Polyangiaceae bacterium]|nr:carbohydrate binding domain-containing protein [Polyangiaceae bacterium]